MTVCPQCLALFVACLCHDLDHRGKTNSFMVKSASPLAAVYSTSTMEHHHFNQTVTILQHEGHNIFKYLNSEEYKKVLSDVRHSILATDLALFFTNHARLKDIVTKTGFSWTAADHRELLMGISMTSCDLCAMYKPWQTQLDLVSVIMEEFWQQGDEEKMKGMTPMAMMDRDKQNELPQLEVGFILGICLPCYKLLNDIMPETEPMLQGVTDNLKKWQQLADEQKEIDLQKHRQGPLPLTNNTPHPTNTNHRVHTNHTHHPHDYTHDGDKDEVDDSNDGVKDEGQRKDGVSDTQDGVKDEVKDTNDGVKDEVKDTKDGVKDESQLKNVSEDSGDTRRNSENGGEAETVSDSAAERRADSPEESRSDSVLAIAGDEVDSTVSDRLTSDTHRPPSTSES